MSIRFEESQKKIESLTPICQKAKKNASFPDEVVININMRLSIVIFVIFFAIATAWIALCNLEVVFKYLFKP